MDAWSLHDQDAPEDVEQKGPEIGRAGSGTACPGRRFAGAEIEPSPEAGVKQPRPVGLGRAPDHATAAVPQTDALPMA